MVNLPDDKFSLSVSQYYPNCIISQDLTIFTNSISERDLIILPLIFNYYKIYMAELYHVGAFLLCKERLVYLKCFIKQTIFAILVSVKVFYN